jgi:hypothetical protein
VQSTDSRVKSAARSRAAKRTLDAPITAILWAFPGGCPIAPGAAHQNLIEQPPGNAKRRAVLILCPIRVLGLLIRKEPYTCRELHISSSEGLSKCQANLSF